MAKTVLLSTVQKKRCTKTVSVPLSFPGRQDAAPRRCTFASGPPPPLPPVPSTRATPWDPRAARSFAFAHAACTRPGGDRGLAPQQCSRSCTASANQLQLQCTAKTQSPVPPRPVCEAPRTALFAAPSSGAAASPQRAAALHTARTRPPQTRTAPAPPRPLVRSVRAAPTRELTPKLRTGRFRGAQ